MVADGTNGINGGACGSARLLPQQFSFSVFYVKICFTSSGVGGTNLHFGRSFLFLVFILTVWVKAQDRVGQVPRRSVCPLFFFYVYN